MGLVGINELDNLSMRLGAIRMALHRVIDGRPWESDKPLLFEGFHKFIAGWQKECLEGYQPEMDPTVPGASYDLRTFSTLCLCTKAHPKDWDQQEQKPPLEKPLSLLSNIMERGDKEAAQTLLGDLTYICSQVNTERWLMRENPYRQSDIYAFAGAA